MTVDIICPNCNFSKRIPREKVPAGVRWATCPRCKRRFELVVQTSPIVLDEEEREPGIGVENGRGPSPWERRSELGVWKGIYQTFRETLFSPERLFRTMACGRGIGEPLAFGLLFGSAGTMVGIFWHFLVFSGPLLGLGRQFVGDLGLGLIFLGILALSPLLVVVGMFVTSAIMHMGLVVVRGGNSGFEATFRVIAYSQATQAIGVVPFVGGMISWLWQAVVTIVGLREIHDTSYGKVFLALLMLTGLVFLVGAAVLFMMFLAF